MPQRVNLDYGDNQMEVELPDSATVVRYNVTYNDPPEVDPWEATRKALDQFWATNNFQLAVKQLSRSGSKKDIV